MSNALTLHDMSPGLRKVVGRESPRATLAEEPDAGHPLVRIWRGAELGNRSAYSTTVFLRHHPGSTPPAPPAGEHAPPTAPPHGSSRVPRAAQRPRRSAQGQGLGRPSTATRGLDRRRRVGPPGATRAEWLGKRWGAWEERVAIMVADGHLRPADAARLAWEGLQGCPPSSRASHAGHDGTHA